MKRLGRLLLLTAAAILPTVALGAVPAHASSAFSGSEPFGYTNGGATFYNRSVNLQGEVYDYTYAGSTTVKFEFYQANVFLSTLTQTRTSSGGSVSFNFTVEGPPGGISIVDVFLCQNGTCWYEDTVQK